MSKKLTKEEIKDLKLSIQEENIVLMRVKRYIQYGFLAFLICVLFLVLFLRNSTSVWRTLLIILGVLSALFTVISYVSYQNGRKHLISQMNLLDSNK